jgi:hypothetical protein
MVVRIMSEFTPNPEPDPEPNPLTDIFKDLSVESVAMPGEPVAAPKPASKWKEFWGGKREKAGKEKTRKPPIPMPRGGLVKPLEQFYVGIGFMLMPVDPHCARIVIDNATKCAESLDELAKINPAVRRFLLGLVSSSAIGAVIMAHLPIVMAVMMHHVPALKQRQEKMFGEFAEMVANMPHPQDGDNE